MSVEVLDFNDDYRFEITRYVNGRTVVRYQKRRGYLASLFGYGHKTLFMVESPDYRSTESLTLNSGDAVTVVHMDDAVVIADGTDYAIVLHGAYRRYVCDEQRLYFINRDDKEIVEVSSIKEEPVVYRRRDSFTVTHKTIQAYITNSGKQLYTETINHPNDLIQGRIYFHRTCLLKMKYTISCVDPYAPPQFEPSFEVINESCKEE